MSEFHLIGPPGCGKTYQLANVHIPRAVQKYGPEKVVACSLTRAAAGVLVARVDLPRANVGTIHSLCYRNQVGQGISKVTPKALEGWRALHPRFPVSPEDIGGPRDPSAPNASRLYVMLETLRHRRVPRDRWTSVLSDFYDAWTEWLLDNGLTDFTGMVEYGLEAMPTAPGKPRALVVDECQDSSPLEVELMRKWGQRADHVLFAGDPLQCQPLGTAVMKTGREEVPIESLVVGDEVATYFSGSSEFRGLRRNGRRVEEIARRRYRGRMVTVRTESGEASRYTSNHRVFCRMRRGRYWCLYLMRRGSNYRVGIARAKYKDTFGVSARARAEGADAAWVLEAFESETEARIQEAVVQAQFGVTGALFSYPRGGRSMGQHYLDRVHEELSGYDPGEILAAYGRDARYPLWRSDSPHKSVSFKSHVTQACNLVDGFHEVRTVDSGWQVARVGWYQADEDVVSLKVEPTEGGRRLYVADGIVTHNSIYGFRGGSPDAVFGPEPREVWRLDQSHRLPKTVLERAREYIVRSQEGPHEFYPTDVEGLVSGVPESWQDAHALPRHIREEGTTAFLASCHYMLAPLVKTLRELGVAYGNPYSEGGSPLRTKAGILRALFAPLEREDRSTWWTRGQLGVWAARLRTKDTLVRGAKTALEKRVKGSGVPLTADELEEFFLPAAVDELLDAAEEGRAALLDWFLARITKQTGWDYALRVWRKHGLSEMESPSVIVSSIHGLKGGEADRVVLFPDISPKDMQQGDPQERARVFYVGMTRARSELLLASPATGLWVNL